MDASGDLFGTTYYGGSANLGTVFELKAGKNNTYSQKVLYSFQGGDTDGEYPYYAGVTLDAKGNIYGTTYYGGSQSNGGTVYELKLSGGKYKENVLHAFAGGSSDGCYPRAEVIFYKGNLFLGPHTTAGHTGGNCVRSDAVGSNSRGGCKRPPYSLKRLRSSATWVFGAMRGDPFDRLRAGSSPQPNCQRETVKRDCGLGEGGASIPPFSNQSPAASSGAP